MLTYNYRNSLAFWLLIIKHSEIIQTLVNQLGELYSIRPEMKVNTN